MKEKLGLPEEVNFVVAEKFLDKQLDIFLKFGNEEMEEREREIMTTKNMDFQAFQQYTRQILDAQTVSEDDKETLILLLVKKYRKLSGDSIEEMLKNLKELNKKRYKLEKSFQKKNAQLKKKDRDKIAQQQWSMIKIIKNYLLTYALLDSTIQILFQMPIIDIEKLKHLRQFGFRKVWQFQAGLQHYAVKPDTFSKVTYEDYIFCKSFEENGDRTGNCPKFVLDQRAFNFQCMNAFIVAIILL